MAGFSNTGWTSGTIHAAIAAPTTSPAVAAAVAATPAVNTSSVALNDVALGSRNPALAADNRQAVLQQQAGGMELPPYLVTAAQNLTNQQNQYALTMTTLQKLLGGIGGGTTDPELLKAQIANQKTQAALNAVKLQTMANAGQQQTTLQNLQQQKANLNSGALNLTGSLTYAGSPAQSLDRSIQGVMAMNPTLGAYQSLNGWMS